MIDAGLVCVARFICVVHCISATLMKDLGEVLDPDELHMFYILLKDVTIQVRCCTKFGEDIVTNIGTPQGNTLGHYHCHWFVRLPLLFKLCHWWSCWVVY